MPSRTISTDLKERIPILRYELCFDVKDICKILGIKKTAVYQVLQSHHLPVEPIPKLHACRPRIFSATHLNFIRNILAKDKEIYLDEIQDQLLAAFGIKPHITTIWRTIRRLNFSHKKTSPRAIERDSMRRAIYMNTILEIAPDPEMLMFTDESAKDERTSSRRYGWSLCGVRCATKNYFVRGRRYSILPVLSLDGIIAHDIIEGSVTSEIFLRFLRDMVVCVSSHCFSLFSSLIMADSTHKSISGASKRTCTR